MNNEIGRLVHRQIVIDLTIRTLERDWKYIETFKIHNALYDWIEVKVKDLKQDLRMVKSQLSKMGVRIQSEKRDGDFTVFEVLVRGTIFKKRYMNVALFNWVNEEVKRLLGLPYHTAEDRK